MVKDDGKAASSVRHGLWRNTLSLSVAGLLTTLIGIARALLLPKILATPTEYGLLLIVNLIAGFGIYAHLGVTTGVYRQIPYLRGAGIAEDQIDRLRDSGLGFVGLAGLTAAFVVLLIAGDSAFTSGLTYAAVIVGGAALVLLRNLTAYLTNLYQAERRFSQLARIEVVYSFCSVILTLTSAYFWGVAGIVIAQVTVELSFVVVYWARFGRPLRPRLDLGRTWRVLKIGLPLTVVTLLRYAMENTDTVFIARFIGGDVGGFFRLAMVVGLFVNLVPAKLGTVLNPEIAYQTGRRSERGLLDNLLRYTEINALLSSLIAAVGAILIRVLLPLYLPNYLPAAPLAYIVMGRMVFFSTMMVAGNTLINQLLERRTMWRWIILQAAFLVTAVGLVLWTYLGQGTVFALVLVNSAVICVYALVLCFFAVRELQGGFRGALAMIARILVPAALCALAALTGWIALELLADAFFLWRLLGALAAAALLLTPYLVYKERRLGLFGRLWRSIFGGKVSDGAA